MAIFQTNEEEEENEENNHHVADLETNGGGND
jgi:hypothetical protein